MPELRGAQFAATLVGALLAAGCAGEARTAGDSAASTPATRSPSASTPSSPTLSASASRTLPGGEAANCLFTVAQVSRVLGGTWERDAAAGAKPCLYTSDRGAVFTTTTVNQAVGFGLVEAREECLPGVKPIAMRGGGSVCVEREASEDYVVGNIGSRDRLWLLLIGTSSARPHKPELSAMVALVGAVPK
jgi:hypothetical protein